MVLRVGDLVKLQNPAATDITEVGQVNGCYVNKRGMRCTVVRFSQRRYITYQTGSLMRVCARCKNVRDYHLESGRCLFGAGSWT